MRNFLSCVLLAVIASSLVAITVVTIPKIAETTFIIPGKLLYRPYLDCRSLGGAQVLELRLKQGLFHIKALCGSGLIYNYVYTAEGEQAPGEVPNLDPGIFEELERAVK